MRALLQQAEAELCSPPEVAFETESTVTADALIASTNTRNRTQSMSEPDSLTTD